MKKVALAVVLAFLAACAQNHAPSSTGSASVATVDWNNAKTWMVEATDAGLKGEQVVLLENQPSILTMKNSSQAFYSIASEEFFDALDPWKFVHVHHGMEIPFYIPSIVSSSGGGTGILIQRVPATPKEILLTDNAKIKSIDLLPGEVTDFYFIAKKVGNYIVNCVMHAESTKPCTPPIRVTIEAK